MADNRTGPAVQKLVESIHEDVGEALDLIRRGLDKLRILESQTTGINGLSGKLKAKGAEIELAIGVIEEEAEQVAEKMLREKRPATPIDQHVDTEHATKVLAARGAE